MPGFKVLWMVKLINWTNVLLDDDSFTDGIPSAQADFVTLILARADYKNAKGE